MNQEKEENQIASKYYNLIEYVRPDGDLNLFLLSGNRRNEVMIGGEDNDWDTYCMGYRRAADALVLHVTQDDLSQRRDYSRYWESTGYTILFLYRHYLELRLKELFLACGGQLDRINNQHKLFKLWEIFLAQHSEFEKECGLQHEEKTDEVIKSIETAGTIISQFDEVDQKSTVFRYPVTKTGKVTLEAIQVDMVRLKEMLGWTSLFLDGWSVGIYECWQDEQRSRYEARIQDQIYMDEQALSCETVEADCEVEDGFRD